MKKKFDAVLVDGRNSVYRAVFAGAGDERFLSTGDDYSVIIFRFLHKYLNDFSPSSFHIFWDTPSAKIWRKDILDSYKSGRDNSRHGFDVEGEVNKCSRRCLEMSEYIGIYQYQRSCIEADDLIYAWCRMNRRKGKVIIISSDRDLLQIPYLFDNVELYSPLSKGGSFIEVPDVDPVELKCFTGETTDAIPGYRGIGPKKGSVLVSDLPKRMEFFKNNPKDIYDRNKKLIDLSLCPHMQENIDYIARVMSKDKSFNGKKSQKMAFSVRGLMKEYNRTILPFKFIGKNK